MFGRKNFFSLSAAGCPEMESVPCKVILVFIIIREPFGPTDKGLRESGELAVNWLPGSIFTTARAGYLPSPSAVKSL
jgi:hypothetical protein